ncbi:hypothetical protein OH76DRAFT_1421218 [Lentinus brumalis]|uniref:Uncharacterized protein n=1 Tax=Lentinus brumalis TaxID=2498619 RepID=A0A371CWT4_9APHY|nr:hypothetical protein OH76DRAFT_1421218 [Polyporus brumalis]
MPALTLPDQSYGNGWGAPEPGDPWDLPTLIARGNGMIRLVDNEDTTRVNRLERLSLEFHVPCAGDDVEPETRCVRIEFPARRQAARPWRHGKPVEFELFQLQAPHEQGFLALHAMLSYFAASHCPSDDEIIQRQWHAFGRAVWDIVEDARFDEGDRVLEVAAWGRDNMPDEVFEHPWWWGRWDWYPPLPNEVEYMDEENVSEFEFGEGLDGLPVPEGTFPPPFWAAWEEDGVGPSTATSDRVDGEESQRAIPTFMRTASKVLANGDEAQVLAWWHRKLLVTSTAKFSSELLKEVEAEMSRSKGDVAGYEIGQ